MLCLITANIFGDFSQSIDLCLFFDPYVFLRAIGYADHRRCSAKFCST